MGLKLNMQNIGNWPTSFRHDRNECFDTRVTRVGQSGGSSGYGDGGLFISEGEPPFTATAESPATYQCCRCGMVIQRWSDHAGLFSKVVRQGWPPKPNPKLRRRIKDALRKTATNDDLITIAGLLGVKTE